MSFVSACSTPGWSGRKAGTAHEPAHQDPGAPPPGPAQPGGAGPAGGRAAGDHRPPGKWTLQPLPEAGHGHRPCLWVHCGGYLLL